jgi:hypothetical protein
MQCLPATDVGALDQSLERDPGQLLYKGLRLPLTHEGQWTLPVGSRPGATFSSLCVAENESTRVMSLGRNGRPSSERSREGASCE